MNRIIAAQNRFVFGIWLPLKYKFEFPNARMPNRDFSVNKTVVR